MAASYDMIIVRSSVDLVVDQVVAFLRDKGFTRIRIAKHSDDQPNSVTNAVIFISPEQGPKGWVTLATWAAELGVDFNTWYLDNPLAKQLSSACPIAISLWTFKAGLAAGYNIWKTGERQEWGIVGASHELHVILKDSGDCSLLAACLDEPGFDYVSFMEEQSDLELGTALLAARLGLREHLLDVMDMIDGDGGIAIVNGEYMVIDMNDWTCVTFDAP